MDPDVPVIRALPQEVAGQIRSSSVVTNLNGVILELVKNSLDANASAVTINVDFQKGTCSVEDDGIGIPPVEFYETGGLGKLHHTSKFDAINEVYGCKGIFLPSLISMSLVTITSRHKSFHSTNSVMFRHSIPISRLCPAPLQHELLHPRHGTRVTVNDLFSNLPVRVKLRAQELRRNEDIDREWGELKRVLTGLLLAYQKPIKLSITDASKSRKLVFRGKSQVSQELRKKTKDQCQHSFDLGRVRSILGQAGFISPCDFPSWVAAMARSSNTLIEAAISLLPSPTKQVQFISFGINPIISQDNATLLFSEVNKLFALSDFGMEDASSVEFNDELETSTLGDRMIGNKKSKPRANGVNRWPMFYLRITTDLENKLHNPDERSQSSASTSIQKISNVVSAMFCQFLEQYNFSSQQTRRVNKRRQGILTTSEQQLKRSQIERPDQENIGTQFTSRLGRTPCPERPSDSKTFKSFGSWSRVKSGTGVVYDDICAGLPRGKCHPSSQTDTTLDAVQAAQPASSIISLGNLQLEDPYVMEAPEKKVGLPSDSVNEHDTPNESQEPPDEIVPWTDPFTKKTIHINKRTGQTVTAMKSRVAQRSLNDKSGRNAQTDTSSRWFDTFLEKWENPTFPIPELAIPSAAPKGTNFEKRSFKETCVGCDNSHSGLVTGFTGAIDGRLSKSALKEAKVIAQVDNKFILLKTHLVRERRHDEEETLVLVDQHAADERCRVEALFAEVCGLSSSQPVDTTKFSKPLSFKSSIQEAKLLETRSGYFASWGCLYEVRRKNEGHCQIEIKCLPTLIAERCRVEPKLAIDMLRSEIWERSDIAKASTKFDPQCSKDLNGMATGESVANVDPHHYWLERIGSCPKKIVDLITSRACRSAIMFNDTLSLADCESLVFRLANCAFPFHCAHGRPSMIPIISMGSNASISASHSAHQAGPYKAEGRPAGEPCSDFVTAFSKWQKGSS